MSIITKDDIDTAKQELESVADQLREASSDLAYITLPDGIDSSDLDYSINRALEKLDYLMDELDEYPVSPPEVDSYIDGATVKVRWSREDQQALHMTLVIGNPSPDRIQDDEDNELDQDNNQCAHWHDFLRRLPGDHNLYDQFGNRIITLTIE